MYCSESDILKQMSSQELARLTGDPTGAVINHDRVDYAILRAGSTVDVYLQGRYPVPFTGDIDPLVNSIALELTICFLYDYAYSKMTIPPPVVRRRAIALKLLDELREGIVVIPAYMESRTPFVITNRKNGSNLLDDDYKTLYGI